MGNIVYVRVCGRVRARVGCQPDHVSAVTITTTTTTTRIQIQLAKLYLIPTIHRTILAHSRTLGSW